MPETDEEKRRKRERDALLLLFAFLLSDAYHRLTSTIQSYIAGTLGSSWVLSDTLTEILTDAHSHAAYLGRRLAGVRNPFGSGDVRFGRSVMLGQTRYLAGLVNDLANGEYVQNEDGTFSGNLQQRIDLFTLRARGTANEAVLLAGDPERLIWWRMNALLKHCRTCPVFAASSPRKAKDWDVQPGSADCECLSNCGCDFIDEDGNVVGFQLPEDLD